MGTAVPDAPRKNHSLITIFGDPALFRKTALPFFLGLLVLANLGVAAWKKTLTEQRRENLLQRDALDPDKFGAVVRYDWSVGEDLPRFLRHIPNAEKTPLVILAGMSQMYAINDGKPSELTIVENLDDALAKKGARAFGLAAPNLSNEEALFLLSNLLLRPQTKPDIFLYGVCFDKFRNIDLRPAFGALLRHDPALAARYSAIASKHASTHPLASRQMLAALVAPDAAKSAEAETAENRLRNSAATLLPIVATRMEMNALVQIELFALRNAVFRIKASTKRPILQARYDLNREFLSLLVDVAHEEGITPALYIIPLNPQAEAPYVTSQYEEFKSWLSALALEKQVRFVNLEKAVPPEDWGLSDGEPDFKHFRASGHQKTANAILSAFEPLLINPRNTPAEPKVAP